MKDKREGCVELNIYVECGKCRVFDPKTPCDSFDKKDDDDTCVKINLFVDCDKNHRCVL